MPQDLQLYLECVWPNPFSWKQANQDPVLLYLPPGLVKHVHRHRDVAHNLPNLRPSASDLPQATFRKRPSARRLPAPPDDLTQLGLQALLVWI